MPNRYRLFFFPMVLLVVVLIIFYPGLNLPSVTGLLRVPPKASTKKSTVKIWANKRSGLYYCPDSKFYGKLSPGAYMSQDEAIKGGYQPAAQEACR